jgi:hypothetical protein
MMERIAQTRIPAYLLRGDDETLQIAQAIGELVGSLDPGRWTSGRMFDGARWTPGCKVCALGAAVELLVDPDVLPTLQTKNDLVSTALYPAYQERYGPVDVFAFNSAVGIIIELNDGKRMKFAEIRDVIREANNELNATR